MKLERNKNDIGPILAHGVDSAWPMASTRSVRPMPVVRWCAVTVFIAGAMARSVATLWWPKGEAVGGVRRWEPQYTCPASRGRGSPRR
jgi:hypothetical protein